VTVYRIKRLKRDKAFYRCPVLHVDGEGIIKEKIHMFELECVDKNVVIPPSTKYHKSPFKGSQSNKQTNKQNKLRTLSRRENYIDRATTALLAKLVSTFADRGCLAVSVTDSYGRILGFLDRNRHFFFQVAPHLYSRG
jgi:hypothetical protein